MTKHSAKRFDSKDNLKKRAKKNKKTRNTKKKVKIGKIFLLLIILAIIILYFKEPISELINKVFKSDDNKTEDTNSVSLSDILATEGLSKYETKKLEGTTFNLANLFLKYENNITVIEFELINEDSKEQVIPVFTFTLLDENSTDIISYDLSSKKIIASNDKKQFVLIASRDVSNATDYKIDIKK